MIRSPQNQLNLKYDLRIYYIFPLSLQSIKNKNFKMNSLDKNSHFDRLMPFAYGIGAALAISANNPFSVLRFRLQTMPELLRQGELLTPYTGLLDCAKRILKEEKITGFWKGNFSVLVRFYPAELFNFFLKQSFSKLYNSNFYLKHSPQFIINSLSGISSGFVTITLLYPLDYARLKLTNNIRSQKRKIWSTIYNTFKQQGIAGIYRGVLLSYLGMTLFRGSFFGFYDTFKVKSTSYLNKFFVSYSAATFSMFLVSPLQTVVRRMMMTSGHQFKYAGYIDCTKQILKKDGIKGFYRGGSMIPIESILVGIMFTLFDKIFTEVKSIEDYSL